MYRYDIPGAGRLLTVAEFQAFEDDTDDTLELDEGRLIREPPPGARHGWLQVRLATALQYHAGPRRLGLVLTESGIVLSTEPAIVRGPDISFTRADRIDWKVPPEGFSRLPPDLAIEVISPSQTADQVYQKVVQYLRAGVSCVWVVHPRSETVTEYRSPEVIRLLQRGDELRAEDLLPGFAYPLEELFAPLG
jgi:Uma2 family endonuclease